MCLIDGFEWRYILSIRFPRYSDDCHEVYIAPCVHFVDVELEEAHSFVTGQEWRKSFPTLGGSLGLYAKEESYKDWPVDNEKGALALISQFQDDIKEIAVPFWENLTPRSQLLKAVEANSRWAKRSAHWKYHHVILRYFERGIDSAMELVLQNPKKYREIETSELKKSFCLYSSCLFT